MSEQPSIDLIEEKIRFLNRQIDVWSKTVNSGGLIIAAVLVLILLMNSTGPASKLQWMFYVMAVSALLATCSSLYIAYLSRKRRNLSNKLSGLKLAQFAAGTEATFEKEI
jgi:Na+/melibiose symporter-like transporter